MRIDEHNLCNYQSIKTIDAHTEGEPLRIITEGYPTIEGKTILEKRQYLRSNLDHLRQLLMFEPRGHADMYGALITPPCSPDADFGILFMHNEGYSSMCGHGIIAAVTVAIETKAIEYPDPTTIIGIDSPAGFIKAYAQYDQYQQLQVSFDNVMSFVEQTNQSIFISGLGDVNYDIAFGGAYYVFIDADTLGLSCTPENADQLITLGREIKQSVMKSTTIHHPESADLGFIYGTIFYSSKTTNPHSHSTHVCIFADGELDRSPTGTGVSARAALLKEKSGLTQDCPIIIESIVGGQMTVKITQTHVYHGKEAVIPNVSGRAYITGTHTFLLHPNDIFPKGFILR